MYPKPPAKPPEKAEEGDYLQQQADQAKAAMTATLHDVADVMRNTVDVRLWARKYPWLSTGAALAAGFVTACVIIPDADREKLKEEARREAMSTWEKIKQAWKDVPSPIPPRANGIPETHVHTAAPEVEVKPAQETSWISTLLHEGVKAIRPLIMSFITSSLTNLRQPPPGHDGAGPEVGA